MKEIKNKTDELMKKLDNDEKEEVREKEMRERTAKQDKEERRYPD